jgi:putative DNA primase/helicase
MSMQSYNAVTQRIINHPDLAYDDCYHKEFPDHYRENGNSLCPFHNDTTPSMAAYKRAGHCYGDCPGKRPGSPYKKHTVIDLCALKWGCTWKEARQRLAKQIGLDLGSGYDPNNYKGRPIVKIYDYQDESGELLYQVCRLDPKGDFPMRRPDNGGWAWKMGDTRRVLYKLPDVIQADMVWICEGEKDSDNISALGLCGTTAPNGAQKMPGLHKRFKILEALRGKAVILLGDNDTVGRKHVQQVARLLQGIATSIKIIDPPDLPEKGDVSDFIEIHGPEKAKELLLSLVESAPEYVPSEEPETEVGITEEQYNFSDVGNCRRLAVSCKGRVHYSSALGWHVYDDSRWIIDNLSLMQHFAKKTIARMFRMASAVNDSEARRNALRWALTSESAPRINSMISLLPSEPGISVTPDVFDQDQMLFNCLTGTIDLRTGQLRPHDPKDFITRISSVKYDPTAKAPRWERFVLEVMNEDHELAAFLQRLMGYATTGCTREQIWTLFWGKGQNGKSTFLQTIFFVLGDYCVSTSPSTFIATTGDRIRNDLARLRGARCIIVNEFPAKQLDAETLKSFTGQDVIHARFLHKEGFDFSPSGKLFFTANARPVVKDPSDAFWRRPLLVPFNRQFSETATRDPNLRETLQREASGILRWLVEGCLAWQREGLNPPATVLEAVRDYRAATDLLVEFLEASCEFGRDYVVSKVILYEAYLGYSEEHKIRKPLSRQRFNEDLRGRDQVVECRDGSARTKVWRGIALKGASSANENVHYLRNCGRCDVERLCPVAQERRDPKTCVHFRSCA